MIPSILIGFFACAIGIPLLLRVLQFFGFYEIVHEKRYRVYTLFGNVVAVLSEPGIYCLWTKMGWRAGVIHWLGKSYTVDMRLDQTYLRSQPVNSEEGAPMGIGVWYEMFISDPIAYLFKNTDPRGSLKANVANAAVRCLSNMKLADMMEDRHAMSQSVRHEVSPRSDEWGFQLGSVYIRKVHFRDVGMVRQIEEKVVNRLRQVTSAIKQDGANQVGIITSSAERTAAIEFAKAQAVRPEIVGAALARIGADPEIATAVFEILETQKMLDGQSAITLMPRATNEVMKGLLATGQA